MKTCEVKTKKEIPAVFEAGVRKEYEQITRALIQKKLTITTMESATAGQIASLLTDTEGSSAILKGAFVTYSNEAKILQGVPREVIETFSVYSRETAEAMADSCRKTYGADIGIGVTGTMGNVDPANAEFSEPGKVYYALSTEAETRSFYVELAPQPLRYLYKLAVAEKVAQNLKKLLQI